MQKESKERSEENAERMKIFKRAFKRYRDEMLKNEELMTRLKGNRLVIQIQTRRRRSSSLRIYGRVWQIVRNSSGLRWTRKRKTSAKENCGQRLHKERQGSQSTNKIIRIMSDLQ